MTLLPDGTIPVLLSHFEQVSDVNRRRISEFEQRRDWDGLARFAQDNLTLDKSNSDWWLVAGYAYSQGGQRQRAIECYSEVVRLAPEDALGWSLLAQSYRLAGQTERALQILHRSFDVRRDAPEPWYLLGEIYSEQGRTEQATQAYGQAIQVDQRYAPAWFGLGKAYKRLGRSADLNKVTQVLEKLDPALAKELAVQK